MHIFRDVHKNFAVIASVIEVVVVVSVPRATANRSLLEIVKRRPWLNRANETRSQVARTCRISQTVGELGPIPLEI